MRIAVIPGDLTGCGTFRMILPADAVQLARPDWDVELYEPSSIRVASDANGNATALKGLRDPHTLDAIVMQRVGKKSTLALTNWARAHGIATIIDADDAMWAIDKDNAAYKSWNSAHDLNWRYLDRAMELADLVTVTTDALTKRYGRHGRVEVIDNYVPEQIFEVESIRHEHDDRIAVGWTGFVATHPKDLTVVGDSVRRVLEDTGAVARVVADAKGAARVWGLSEIDAISPQPLGPAYFQAISTIDIGLVPLVDTHFNRCKSWLKALEFSAMGVPVIASPTPDNLKLAKAGVPLLFAETEGQWYSAMDMLIHQSPAARQGRGAEARRVVREKLTVEAHGEEWAQAWERGINRRKAMSGISVHAS